MQPDFDAMNETDVRETIVRPLLHKLGYAHGTQANIRTEVHLKYDGAFLGHKNPKKDPPLRGRADYICEAITYGRWVVEVKAPHEELTREDAEQAHTYSAHPEIAASHFLLTNGRMFRLYLTGKLAAPLLEWSFDQLDNQMMTLHNILGPEAVQRTANLIRHDVAKPLGMSLPSRLRIVGGEVVYGEHRSDHPLFGSDVMKGSVGSVSGGRVTRLEDGRIEAVVTVRSPFPHLAEINRQAGLEDFVFMTSNEFISTDPDNPTMLQNVIDKRLEPGGRFSPMRGMPEIPLPIGFDCTAYTEATGFVSNGEFRGVLSFDYDFRFFRRGSSGIPHLDMMFDQFPRTARLTGEGEFRVVVNSVPS